MAAAFNYLHAGGYIPRVVSTKILVTKRREGYKLIGQTSWRPEDGFSMHSKNKNVRKHLISCITGHRVIISLVETFFETINQAR